MNLKKTLTVAIMLLFGVVTFAQENYVLKGTVTSSLDNATIPGVNVVKVGTTNGTTTDIDGNYELKVVSGDVLQFSYTDHDQNSVYGDLPYLAQQRIGFGQLTWDKTLNKHDLLFGVAARYNFYNDNILRIAQLCRKISI